MRQFALLSGAVFVMHPKFPQHLPNGQIISRENFRVLLPKLRQMFALLNPSVGGNGRRGQFYCELAPGKVIFFLKMKVRNITSLFSHLLVCLYGIAEPAVVVADLPDIQTS